MNKQTKAGKVTMSTPSPSPKIYNWTLYEAIEQACAALPDPAFGDRYGIAREDLRSIQLAVEQGAAALNESDGIKTLHLAISLLPKAWPEPGQQPDDALTKSLHATLKAAGAQADAQLRVDVSGEERGAFDRKVQEVKVYETGNDTTAWYAKVVEQGGLYNVIAYDADGDIRADQGKSTSDKAAAIAHADNAVLPVSERKLPEEGMKFVKSDDLMGAALDWAVAKCEGEKYEPEVTFSGIGTEFPATLYSTDPMLAVPIIERERISTIRCDDDYRTDAQGFATSDRIPVWFAERGGGHSTQTSYEGEHMEPTFMVSEFGGSYGPSSLIAAMRCRVKSKLGEQIEVPAKLLQ